MYASREKNDALPITNYRFDRMGDDDLAAARDTLITNIGHYETIIRCAGPYAYRTKSDATFFQECLIGELSYLDAIQRSRSGWLPSVPGDSYIDAEGRYRVYQHYDAVFDNGAAIMAYQEGN